MQPTQALALPRYVLMSGTNQATPECLALWRPPGNQTRIEQWNVHRRLYARSHRQTRSEWPEWLLTVICPCAYDVQDQCRDVCAPECYENH